MSPTAWQSVLQYFHPVHVQFIKICRRMPLYSWLYWIVRSLNWKNRLVNLPGEGSRSGSTWSITGPVRQSSSNCPSSSLSRPEEQISSSTSPSQSLSRLSPTTGVLTRHCNQQGFQGCGIGLYYMVLSHCSSSHWGLLLWNPAGCCTFSNSSTRCVISGRGGATLLGWLLRNHHSPSVAVRSARQYENVGDSVQPRSACPNILCDSTLGY